MADSNSKTESNNSNLRTYHGITYDITDPKFQGLSRNAIKRLLREEIWNATREKRNQYQKEKKKQKNAERRKLIQEGLIPAPPPKRPRREDVSPSSVQVIIDCSFSSYMTQKEINSMQAQLVRCYSANRSALHPMHITITSFDEPLKTAFEKKTSSYVNWKDVDFIQEPYQDKFTDKSKLIYLSADSDQVAHELEEDKIYIIGGIVDKNRHKGLCQDKAAKQGIRTAQLPIGEYIQMASRKVLTVNHVYEIMLKYLEYKNWEKAFMEIIPQRKLKDSQRLNNADEKSQDDDERQQDENNAEEQQKDAN